MNTMYVWRGVPDGQPVLAWESSSESLRLSEMLQQLNEAFDGLDAADSTVTSDAA